MWETARGRSFDTRFQDYESVEKSVVRHQKTHTCHAQKFVATEMMRRDLELFRSANHPVFLPVHGVDRAPAILTPAGSLEAAVGDFGIAKSAGRTRET